MSLQKSTNGSVCTVTFTLPQDIEAESIYVVGEWDGWEQPTDPKEKLESGERQAQNELEKQQAYEYRYLIDSTLWMSDPEPDDAVPNPYGEDNSVVRT
ncbi:MAG: isoamylase early set domain-containing protein [Anaerolineae bacterium]